MTMTASNQVSRFARITFIVSPAIIVGTPQTRLSNSRVHVTLSARKDAPNWLANNGAAGFDSVFDLASTMTPARATATLAQFDVDAAGLLGLRCKWRRKTSAVSYWYALRDRSHSLKNKIVWQRI